MRRRIGETFGGGQADSSDCAGERSAAAPRSPQNCCAIGPIVTMRRPHPGNASAANARQRRPSRRPRRTAGATAAFLLTATALLQCTVPSRGGVSCEDTATCERLLRKGSECVEGMCTNPFVNGCLRTVLGEEEFPAMRTCNSDDDGGSGKCAPSVFDYDEIRIAPGNWESTIFAAWIMQIVLSELLNIPVTIETNKGAKDGEGVGKSDGDCSFYDETNRFAYAKNTYNWAGLEESNRVLNGDCRQTSNNCAHVIPEIWNGQTVAWAEHQVAGTIEPVLSTDMVGQFGWFVPRFTVERDPSLASLAGLQGEANRRKLARTFKRPTTWIDYCRYVSSTLCFEDDGVASRWPEGEAEEGSYFKQGAYIGHFRATEKNDCDEDLFASPSGFPSCTGHFVDATCKWSISTEAQMYWHGVKMESNGPLEPHGGYSWSHMIQIWHAANATRSDIMMTWWTPDFLPNIYRGGPAEFVRVALAKPTEQCANSRVDDDDRCAEDAVLRRGEVDGSCDYEAHVLKKALSSSLERNRNAAPKAARSGGYDAIKRLRISDLVVDRLLVDWMDRGVDQYGYDPRHVVCEWVAGHLDDLKKFIPTGYPHELREESLYGKWYHYLAMAFGGIAALFVFKAAAASFHWRKRRVLVYAQVNFIFMTLVGFLLVSAGSITVASEPSLVSCVMRQWLVLLGYSMELLPVIVKVAAINTLLQSGKRMKRAELKKETLYKTVGFITFLVAVYLSVWTALDPPTRTEELLLMPDTNAEGGNFVEVGVECASSSNAWTIGALAWQGILLLCATVLGIQTRNVRQEFNESQRLAAMIYCHFFFIAMRLVVYLLGPVIRADVAAAATSFLLSADTIVALGIYLVPKLLDARKPQTDYCAQRRRASIIMYGDSEEHERRWSANSRQSDGTRVLRRLDGSFFNKQAIADALGGASSSEGSSKIEVSSKHMGKTEDTLATGDTSGRKSMGFGDELS